MRNPQRIPKSFKDLRILDQGPSFSLRKKILLKIYRVFPQKQNPLRILDKGPSFSLRKKILLKIYRVFPQKQNPWTTSMLQIQSLRNYLDFPQKLPGFPPETTWISLRKHHYKILAPSLHHPCPPHPYIILGTLILASSLEAIILALSLTQSSFQGFQRIHHQRCDVKGTRRNNCVDLLSTSQIP